MKYLSSLDGVVSKIITVCVDTYTSMFQLFGGGPLSKKVGDSLARKGVRLFILYGWFVSFAWCSKMTLLTYPHAAPRLA